MLLKSVLTFGGPEERQVLVNEMLGYTDENEPLQVLQLKKIKNFVPFLHCLRSLLLTLKQIVGDDEGSIWELRSAKGT